MDYKQIVNQKQPVYVTKINDTSFEGNHPNGINNGYKIYGIITQLEKDSRMEVISVKLDDNRYLSTSMVTKIVQFGNRIHVHTLNSIYQIKDNE